MKEEALSWLLEAETPTIRYLALVLAVAGQVRPCSRAAAGQQPRTPPTVLAP